MVYPNRVVLNINQKYVMPIPYTQQGDTARVLTFNILDNGVPFSLQGKTVRAKIVKPDNTKCYNDLTITNATNGECALKLTNQILAVAGKVNCQLEIKEGEELLSTIIFSIDVEPSIDISGAVESTNEFSALTLGLSKLDEWDKYFKETSVAIEEKYTERLNGIASSLEEETNNLKSEMLSLAKKDDDSINARTLKVKGNNVYHVGYKPTPADIGAISESNKELKFFGNVKSATVVFDKAKLKNGVKVSFLTSNKMGTDKWYYSINDVPVSSWNMSQEAKYCFDFTKLKSDGSLWMYETLVANPYRKNISENRYDGGVYSYTGELNSIKVYLNHSTNVCENLTALIEYY